MADWSLPTLTSTYANFRQYLVDRDSDAATQFSVGTPTNMPTGTIRWNTSINRWQKWSGTAWGELATTYALTGVTCTSFSNTGNTTLGDSSADSVTVNAATLSFANPATVAGTITYSGAVSFGGGVTLGDAAADPITLVSNSATTPVGGFTFSGSIVNFATGLQSGGETVLTNVGTQNVSNKTIGAGNTITSATQVLDTGTITVDSVGYRGLPQNARTAAYTLAMTDAGKHISITTGGVTIPANATTAFPIGTTIVVFNNSTTSQNIAITTDTLYLSGTTTTGTRALAARGLATLVKVAATAWAISGAGVS